MNRNKILVLTDWYIPGKKAGGPIRSVQGFVENLKDVLEISVFTSDRDLGDKAPYTGIAIDEWIEKDGFRIFYSSIEKRAEFRRQILADYWDVIYMNSLFSVDFTLKPLIGLKTNKKIHKVLAPRGMFAKGALGEKSFKKQTFLRLARMFNLFKNVTWHCTNENERSDVQLHFPEGETVVIPNLSDSKLLVLENVAPKKEGELRLVYIGRVASVKNLLFFLQVLKDDVLDGITLDVYGPIEDREYWNRCQELIQAGNLKARYIDELPHERVQKTLMTYHFMVSPTKGENFGHTILESLSTGTPVLISDQTPWRSLKSLEAGFDLSLDSHEEWKAALDLCLALDQNAYNKLRKGAMELAKEKLNQKGNIELYKRLFSDSIHLNQ